MSFNELISYGLYSIIGIITIIVLIYISYRSKHYKKEFIELSKIQEQFESTNNLNEFKSNILTIISEIELLTKTHAVTQRTINELDELFPKIITGRNSIDAILSNKAKLCKRNNIVLDLKVAPISFDNIIDADLIPLLGNIMDNAIEAAVLSIDKKVELTVISIKNFNVIKISNSKPIELTPLNNNLKTTKKDSSTHGLGTKIVKMITEKNKGKITYIDNDNEFIVKIVLPS